MLNFAIHSIVGALLFLVIGVPSVLLNEFVGFLDHRGTSEFVCTTLIEPPFSLAYVRNKRMPDDTTKAYQVEDHAFRVWRGHAIALGVLSESHAAALSEAVAGHKGSYSFHDDIYQVADMLPDYFVTAMQMTAQEHLEMMAAVQPYIDSAISKTVNVPSNYPFEDFKALYLKAWELGLKGVATYRPNATRGEVLSISPQPRPMPEAVAQDVDPLTVDIQRRPTIDLPSTTRKIEYHTAQGKKSLYVSVSFMITTGIIGGEVVSVERPVEFFLPVSHDGDAQQWAAALFRGLSLVARENANTMARLLQDCRKVSWDRGPVTYGTRTKDDGSPMRMYHDSEVAMIAFALQDILHKKGFLDVDGNLVPAKVQAKNATRVAAVATEYALPETAPAPQLIMHGKKCPKCNALAVVKRDGCETCDACHDYLGTCG